VVIQGIVEYGMRNDGTQRRSWLSDLFAERQVYIRSGPHSEYVVLSRALQIGVALGMVAIAALLAIASYNAIAKHLEAAAQQRALAHLQSAARATDQSAEELAQLRRGNDAAQAEIERLTAALQRAEADRQAALSAETEAGAKAAEHSAALAQADAALRSARSDAATRIQELEAALAAATNESRSLATELQEIRASGGVQTVTLSRRVQAALTEATGLRAELDRANLELERLRLTVAETQLQLRNVAARPGVGQQGIPAAAEGLSIAAESTAEQILALKEDLAGARATIAALAADLEAAKGGPPDAGGATSVAAEPAVDRAVPLPPPPAPR
jgi:DNA repair exonuclease SbcCD ATPase subunit